MTKVRCATAIVKTLEAIGTDVVFGYNGHGNWALLDSFEYESNVKCVATRGEHQAVHMADGYYRARHNKAIPIVSTSVGPGNMNIASALSNAFFESSAMLVLAGGGSTHWLDRGGIEEYYRYAPDEWTQTVKAYTKKSVMITRPDTAVDMILRAYKTAVTGRPGPVVVQIPFDIQHSETFMDDLGRAKKMVELCPPGPDAAGIREAAKLIAKAERPMVFVSSGIHNSAAFAELAALVESFGLPIATTTMGKGAYPENKPLSVGVVGRSGAGHANQAAGQCDVLVAIGTHFSDVDTGGWTVFNIPEKTKLIHIDIDASEIARNYPTEIGLHSDPKLAILELIEAMKSVGVDPARFAPWRAQIDKMRTEWTKTVADLIAASAPLSYGYVCDQVSGLINESYPEASVCVDTGHLLSFSPPFFKTLRPNFHHCGFFHCMGWSLPAALGAKFARPDQPAIALIGDGSFLFSNATLATAYEYDQPVVSIIMNNRSLLIERELMEKKYGRSAFVDYKRMKNNTPWGPDYSQIGRAMGAQSVRVESPEDLVPAVRKAVDSGEPYVVDVDIDATKAGYRNVWYPYPSDFWKSRYETATHF
ncbi:MAG: thiamine pyrophosphate-binding protein [Rhizobiales bacterium]|nr:thiamine pyrophosphate-binding protein [Hyphomicrobiales bacterium]